MTDAKQKIKRIDISGYKSIEQMSIELGNMNVMIGENGAGKSNLVSFFNLLSSMMDRKLQFYVGEAGGASTLLFYGSETTSAIDAKMSFSAGSRADLNYHVRLAHAANDTLIFNEETVELNFFNSTEQPIVHALGSGHRETRMLELENQLLIGATAYLLKHCRAYQFHNTSNTARVRQSVYVHDNRTLRHDASNLAAVLYAIKARKKPYYQRIIDTIQQIAPWFEDFILEPLKLKKEMVRLDWKERGREIVFGPDQLSDGTLRAMSLITLLLQPEKELPSLVVIDEPELGLHPSAIVVIAALLKQASHHAQVIVATQSAIFLDEFDPEDVIVVDRENGRSSFTRQDPERLKSWLEEYSLGEIWQKNVIGGGPF
jgi:predicted ATPase